LLGCRFELAGLEPFPDAIKHVVCLRSALAMKRRIVGKSDAEQMPRDPQIKCIVQKQIGQDLDLPRFRGVLSVWD
jgi:hypothetical protein